MGMYKNLPLALLFLPRLRIEGLVQIFRGDVSHHKQKQEKMHSSNDPDARSPQELRRITARSYPEIDIQFDLVI